ncbi:MAG: S8 family serine peptidase [Pirellulaceae bacterium]
MSRRNRKRITRRKQHQKKQLSFVQLEQRQMLAADFLNNEVLVQFQPGIGAAQRMAAFAAIDGMEVKETIHTNVMQRAGMGVMERVTLPQGMAVEDAIRLFGKNKNVVYAEPNYVYQAGAISNDTYYSSGQLWGMYSDDSPTAVGPSGTTNQYGSQAEKAWNDGYTGSSNVFVGIIDEGFQYDHPDLAANAWTNPYDPVDGIDNDGNGYIDDVHGWDFYFGDNSTYDGTADDHGTHVAGTIGGDGGNGAGVAGVNWDVTMISTKFLGPNGGYTSGAIQALDYLTDLKTRHGIDIVASNNSWGGGGYSQALLDAITRSANEDILFVAAAGNSNSNNEAGAYYPSNYSTLSGAGYESVISVASITSTGAKSSFSSYGANNVDIGAPGSSIISTVPTNSYASYSGTSMATPHVTGAVALYASKYANATAENIRNAILASARPTASLSGITVTGGRLDVDAALNLAPPGQGQPTVAIDDVQVVEGDSGTVAAVFSVSLSAAPTQTVTVDFATADGSASAGVDYAAASGTLTFTPTGPLTQTITILVNGDTDVENNETFFVNLSNATNAVVGDSQGQGTISNDDVPPPSIAINNLSIVEGNSGTTLAVFSVSLSSSSAQPITVNFATADGSASGGSDYVAASGTLTFAPGSLTQLISIVVNGDTTVENDETFFVNLSNATNATISDSQGVATIVDDDNVSLPSLSISNVSSKEGSRGTRRFRFSVSLSAASNQAVSVNYATANGTATAGSDYQATSGTLTISAGSTIGYIDVYVYGDRTVEANETFFVNLSSATNATIADNQGVGTIVNDDRGRLRSSSVTLSIEAVAIGDETVKAMLTEATARWIDSGDATAAQISDLNLQVRVADLKGSTLGMAGTDANGQATIWIDRDAAGNGWFVDSTPWDDSEFTSFRLPSGVDLLTVVAHELGHFLGHEHELASSHDVMSETLGTGERHLPGETDVTVDAAIALTQRPTSSQPFGESQRVVAVSVDLAKGNLELAGAIDDLDAEEGFCPNVSHQPVVDAMISSPLDDLFADDENLLSIV